MHFLYNFLNIDIPYNKFLEATLKQFAKDEKVSDIIWALDNENELKKEWVNFYLGFEKPNDLFESGELAYQIILNYVSDFYDRHPDTGWCKTFYSPLEWKERNEKYGLDSELVLVYDGGEVADLLKYWGSEHIYHLNQKLKENDLFLEECTGWYSAIYKT